MESWTLAVSRADHAAATVLDTPTPTPDDGQAVLRVDRVGLTANNVTYAVLGESFRYWDFFPAPRADLGLVPLWGFAEVVASRAPDVPEGLRVYGYLPPASDLVVTPDRAGAHGFRDAAPHRAALPSVYNSYAATAADPSYEAAWEDLQVLYRPLFFTSFVLADWLTDDGPDAGTVALSSASSKTAYGTAFLLRGSGRRVVGLTSPAHVGFTASLGVYDAVVAYDAVADLPRTPTAYLDFAGDHTLRAALRDHLGAALVSDTVVGVTHQDASPIGTLDGPRPEVFFAPDRIRKRAADWGRAGLDERFGAAWRSFAPAVAGWVDVVHHAGPEALRDVWLAVLEGRTAPREGHVVTF